MIRLRRSGQRSFAEGLIEEEIEDLWERGACVRRTKWEGTWQGGLGLLDTEGVQAAEVGRIDSGVLQTRLGAWSQAPCTKQWLQSEHVTSD